MNTSPPRRRGLRGFAAFALASVIAAPALAVEPAAVRLSLLAQMRATFAQEAQPAADLDPAWSSRFGARRIRPSVSARIADGFLTPRLQLSVNPGAAELIDLYTDVRLPGKHRLRVGVWKIPLTWYRAQSFASLLAADWLVTTRHFGAERQWGAAWRRGGAADAGWAWQLGIFQGDNARAAHGTGLARDIWGVQPGNHSAFSRAERVGSTWAGVRKPEVVGRLSWASDALNWQEPSDATHGPATWGVAVSAAWDIDPRLDRDFSERAALEAAFKARGLALHGMMHTAGYLVGGTPSGAGHDGGRSTPLAVWGAAGQAAYRFSGDVFGRGAGWPGDIEPTVSAAWVAYDLGYVDFVEDVVAERVLSGLPAGTGPTMDGHLEVVGGVNLYLFPERAEDGFEGGEVKAQFDVGYTRRSRRDDIIVEAIRWRAQLQFGF
jgi:hypothetical protein